MSSIYDSRQRWKFGFIFAAVLIAILSVVVSDLLIKDLAREERQRMEIWSEATRVMTSENPSLNMQLILKIIQGNTSIPVILCTDQDEVVSYNNIELPENDQALFLKKKVGELKAKNPPIVIDMEDGSFQYLYYDDSTILKRLLLYPYVQLSVVFVFILLAFLALASTKRAEQNNVWEYLRTKEIDAFLLNEMDKDVKRLQTIAERFSKIGSDPDPVPTDLVESIQTALGYMSTRISSKVAIHADLPSHPIWVSMNDSLFAWVIENLTKNAVDAMEGHGDIYLRIEERDKLVRIDLSDTGKGIPKSKFKTVFNPGYTTKQRGWGLGLSLVKRIIESLQGGKIYVKSSELGKGTTFRIELCKYKG